jgi:hypothetical protein
MLHLGCPGDVGRRPPWCPCLFPLQWALRLISTGPAPQNGLGPPPLRVTRSLPLPRGPSGLAEAAAGAAAIEVDAPAGPSASIILALTPSHGRSGVI